MKYFQDVNIQQRILERLTQSIINERLAHAYLFYGQEGCGKEALAFEIAKAVNCNNNNLRPCNSCDSCNKILQLKHPDVKFIFPISNNWSIDDIKERINLKASNPYSKIDLSGHTIISIDRIRELKNESKYATYEAVKKVYIISDADKLTRESANSFLKLLEEPPANLLIILITTSVNSILETIRSRCHLIYFPPLSYSEALSIVTKYRPDTDEVQRAVHMAQGNLKAIFQMLENNIEQKSQLIYEYMKAIAGGNPLSIMEIVDMLTKRRDKNFLMDILNLLTLWFQDVMHLVALGIDTEIINVDFKEELRRFTQSYRYSNFENIVEEIENALNKLHKNVYHPLILTVLAIHIKKNLIRHNGKNWNDI